MHAMNAVMSSDANPAHVSSDANPADAPLSQQRTRALDGQWYSRDEFLDCYGALTGVKIWTSAREDEDRCGFLAYDGLVYTRLSTTESMLL